MPMINLNCSCPIPDTLLKNLSSIVAETIGKPEQYVMAVGSHADVMMGGTSDPAVYVDIKSIGGLSSKVNKDLSKKICTLLFSVLKIPAERVYITFTSFSGDSWGWNNSTFG